MEVFLYFIPPQKKKTKKITPQTSYKIRGVISGGKMM